MGSPTRYTEALAARICSERAAGASLYKICQDPAMPDIATVNRWLEEKHYQHFQRRYAAAKAALANRYAEEIIDIADNEEPQKAKLRIEARKWAAARLAPHLYGEKLQHIGAGGGPIETNELSAGDIARRIAFLLERARREKSGGDRD